MLWSNTHNINLPFVFMLLIVDLSLSVGLQRVEEMQTGTKKRLLWREKICLALAVFLLSILPFFPLVLYIVIDWTFCLLLLKGEREREHNKNTHRKCWCKYKWSSSEVGWLAKCPFEKFMGHLKAVNDEKNNPK